jgi:hypothetical protein
MSSAHRLYDEEAAERVMIEDLSQTTFSTIASSWSCVA